jgi:hypothetical protein
VIATALRFIEKLTLVALGAALAATLASCGSGAVGGNPRRTIPTASLFSPGSGTVMYPGQPTTFTLSGGTGQYIVTSSNQSVLPVDGAARNATSITLISNQVAADTTVTISVRDTGTAPVATADVTVKPGTINNDIQITPSSTQSAGVRPARCVRAAMRWSPSHFRRLVSSSRGAPALRRGLGRFPLHHFADRHHPRDPRHQRAGYDRRVGTGQHSASERMRMLPTRRRSCRRPTSRAAPSGVLHS